MEINQILITLLTIILPLVGAGIGYLIKSNIEKKKKLTDELTKERREMYQQYVNLIIDIFANTKLTKNKPNNNLESLYGFYKKYILYASPNVIQAFSDFFQFAYKSKETLDATKNISLVTRIMLEMRKDIGLNNKGLGENGEMLMRALITDFDEVYKK